MAAGNIYEAVMGCVWIFLGASLVWHRFGASKAASTPEKAYEILEWNKKYGHVAEILGPIGIIAGIVHVWGQF